MIRIIFLSLLSLFMVSCSTMSPRQAALQRCQQAETEGHYTEARYLCLLPALHGMSKAQYALGYLYVNGFGGAVDCESGKIWMQQAAARGDQEAKIALDKLPCKASPTGSSFNL